MMKNWLCILMVSITICLVSGSCTEEEYGNDQYSLGIDTFSSSSSGIMAEMSRINDAFVAEFGAEKFKLSGNMKKNDQHVVERFNKVAADYILSPDFSGYIVYCVSRDGKILASYRFEK